MLNSSGIFTGRFRNERSKRRNQTLGTAVEVIHLVCYVWQVPLCTEVVTFTDGANVVVGFGSSTFSSPKSPRRFILPYLSRHLDRSNRLFNYYTCHTIPTRATWLPLSILSNRMAFVRLRELCCQSMPFLLINVFTVDRQSLGLVFCQSILLVHSSLYSRNADHQHQQTKNSYSSNIMDV